MSGGSSRNPLEIRASGQRNRCAFFGHQREVVIPWKSGQVVRGSPPLPDQRLRSRNPLEIRASGQSST